MTKIKAVKLDQRGNPLNLKQYEVSGGHLFRQNLLNLRGPCVVCGQVGESALHILSEPSKLPIDG